MTLRAKLLRTVGSMVAVRREDGRHGDFSIAKTVLRLAEQLGLATTAEGIETEEQRTKLVAMGCNNGQGFLFSRPLTAEQFEAFLNEQQPPPHR